MDAGELAAEFGDDVRRLSVQPFRDARGELAALDLADMGFTAARVFVVRDVPAGTRRGGHSHRVGTQALFCVRGRIDVELRRGDARATVVLTPSSPGVGLRAGVWAAQTYVDADSELLVLASEPYDPGNYETTC